MPAIRLWPIMIFLGFVPTTLPVAFGQSPPMLHSPIRWLRRVKLYSNRSPATPVTRMEVLAHPPHQSSLALARSGRPDKLVAVLRHPTEKMTAEGMPPVNVTDEEMRALVAYLNSLK